jgi:osomolarity two-component system response regulator SSK1
MAKKIWVKRPGSSATLVALDEADLVDDVRDRILKKYANSLGRQFDAPDLTLRIRPRDRRPERLLGPEELMRQALEDSFPGSQTVEEAIVIEVKPSPESGASTTPLFCSAQSH